MTSSDCDPNQYLIKAIETLKRQIIVISDDYKILASRFRPDSPPVSEETNLQGRFCHQAIFNHDSPCPNCPAIEVIRTNRPVLNHIPMSEDSDKRTCLFAYPLDDPGNRRAIVVLDFHLPSLDAFDEKRFLSNAFLKNLIHSAVDGVIAADMKGKILIFNQAASDISGYTREEAMETLTIRDIYPGRDAHVIMEKMRSTEFGKTGIIKSYKQQILRKDNSTCPISLNASIVYENGQEVATIGVFHDLTETLRIQAELEKTQTQLLQAEKMSSLGKLAAGVAHQLNNPLGGITLFAQLMLEEHSLSEDATSDLMRIQKDVERCSSIVKELLEFARQTKREVQLHDINKTMARTLFMLRNQTLFQNIVIIETYDDNLPEIPMDVQQINHVFMNIILNAADAMAGSGRLTIDSALDGEMARVTISDTGPGIPEDVISHIFEPFFTTKEVGEGTGLGLSMAYGIVKSHGGRLTVKNLDQAGASFTILLPLKQKKSTVEATL